MDYIEQIEKLFNYLELNEGLEEKFFILNLKRKYCNDLNLIGCFLKDYLYSQHFSNYIEDENLYDELVLYFEDNKENLKNVFSKIENYAKYYLMIVFEECDNIQILSAISMINLCYCIDCYPLMLNILHNYYSKQTGEAQTVKAMQELSTLVLKNFENPENNFDYNCICADIDGNIRYLNDSQEKAAV